MNMSIFNFKKTTNIHKDYAYYYFYFIVFFKKNATMNKEQRT